LDVLLAQTSDDGLVKLGQAIAFGVGVGLGAPVGVGSCTTTGTNRLNVV